MSKVQENSTGRTRDPITKGIPRYDEISQMISEYGWRTHGRHTGS